MATQWVLGKVSDALAPTVSGAVSSAGAYAGGAFSFVGNAINGVGEGINNSIRRYGDGTKDYGNAIMDWTAAPAPRSQTASNPLGLAGGRALGKTSVTNPSVYYAPSKPVSETLMTTSKTAPQKRIEGGTPKKALPAPGLRPTTVATAKKNASVAPKSVAPTKTATTPNPGAMRKKPAEITKATPAPKQPGSVKKVTPVKPSTASAPKTTTPARQKVQGNATVAANPLGLKF